MRTWLQFFCLFGLVLSLVAEDTPVSEPVEVLPLSLVDYELVDQSLFVGRVATALVYFDQEIEEPEDFYRSGGKCRIIEGWVELTPDGPRGKAVALVRFMPTETGIVTLPSVEFSAEATRYQTRPLQFVVSEPIRSDNMSLSLNPSKLSVYVGQPLRVDLIWDCSIHAGRLQALNLYPEFFNDSTVQVVIPRTTVAEDRQVGLPVGGRRVIATRTRPSEANNPSMGRIELPLYLRFSEPGSYTIPETRLEVAQLAKSQGQFGRYAAHFNNSLFNPVEAQQKFERVYTTSPEVVIEVLPLPDAALSANFNGLFEPLEIDVSLSHTEVEIGQLIELEVKLSGDAPHGMLELPNLSQMPALRERFLVDEEPARLWHEQGTVYRTRLRVLTTAVQVFPALQFQVFDPELGALVTQSTEPIPMVVKPSKGRDFIPLKSFEGAAVSLSNQPEGIWHNLEANRMNDLLNTLFVMLGRFFLPLMLLGPVGFALLLPVVRERRRRALDASYRARAEAYASFKRQSEGSAEQWQAFLALMAVHFQAKGTAWTLSDSKAALQSVGASAEEIKQVCDLHVKVDAEEFGAGASPDFEQLNRVAKRVMKAAAQLAVFVMGLSLFCATDLRADDWSEAEALYNQAQQLGVGSDAATAAYTEAALKFQAVAENSSRKGEAWYNAGNAWFQVGALGRSIAAYRQAQIVRPFDAKVTDNLAAARAMTLNDVPTAKAWWQVLPSAWLGSSLVLLNFLFWGLLLLHIRYRKRAWLLSSGLVAVCLLTVFSLWIYKQLTAEQAGVVVVDAVYAKKGPGYAYANAFNQALHDGLEFTLLEQRQAWALLELPDTRQCWLPVEQVQFISE